MKILNVDNSTKNFFDLNTGNQISTDEKSKFEGMLNTIDSIEKNQIDTRASITKMLTTGEGDTHELLIASNKAVSQIKTASVFRDKFIESYNTIMNTQI